MDRQKMLDDFNLITDKAVQVGFGIGWVEAMSESEFHLPLPNDEKIKEIISKWEAGVLKDKDK